MDFRAWSGTPMLLGTLLVLAVLVVRQVTWSSGVLPRPVRIGVDVLVLPLAVACVVVAVLRIALLAT